jgi:ATP/maltotriose-dependent transcriptional regulator MalT
MDETNLPTQLRWLRRERGWTQQHLAAQLGVYQRTISAWENGWMQPNPQQLAQLATLFEVPLEMLEALPVPPTTATHERQPHLTKRQRQVLRLVAEGQDTHAIAEQLEIHEQRVKTILWEINRRLGTANRIQAVTVALRLGLLEDEGLF